MALAYWWLLASLVLALVVGAVAARGQELEDEAKDSDEWATN